LSRILGVAVVLISTEFIGQNSSNINQKRRSTLQHAHVYDIWAWGKRSMAMAMGGGALCWALQYFICFENICFMNLSKSYTELK
jgi:hypothetical protein